MYNWPLSIFVLKNTAELLNNVYTEKETELNFAINFFSFHTVIIFIFVLYSYWDVPSREVQHTNVLDFIDV